MKSNKRFQRFGRISLVSALLLSSNPLNATIASAETDAPSKLIINEVYGGGGKVSKDGSVQAPFKNDFIELYNPTNEDISLDEFALTYTNNSGKTVQTFEFNENHVIKANDYFLLRGEATLGNEGDKGFGAVFEADVYFDTPDAGIGMSDEKGNVELKKGEMVIDAVAYGELDTFKGEGTAITGVTLDKSAKRINFTDSNNNSLDFEVVSPSPTMSGQVEGEVALVDLVKVADIKSQAAFVGKQVTIEGLVSAVDVKISADQNTLQSYIQDESGGLMVLALDAKKGQKVQVTGTVQSENGVVSLLAEEVAILDEKEGSVPVKSVPSHEAGALEGWLVSVTGDVTAKTADTITINNELTIYVDSTVGSTAGMETGQFITVQGVMAVNNQNQSRLILSSMDDLIINEEKIPNTMELKKIAGFSTGLTDEDGGVAEIVKYNADNGKFYVINGKSQTIDIVSLNGLTSGTEQQLEKEKSINIADVVNKDTFQYGDLTGIDINTTLKTIVAAVQDVDYTKNGKIVVMNYDGEILKTYDAGVQPDMVKITADGKYILSADEAEPRQGLANGIDPEGSVTIVEVETGKVTQVKFDDESVIANDVHIRNNGTKAEAIKDLEPEYIALSEDGKKAYVSLQENNAIATIDVEAGKVVSVKSLGYKDHSLPGNELDAARNEKIEIESLPILGAYMPDSIAHVTIGGVDYLVTANEGDATEWEEFENVTDFKDVKDSITLNPDLFKGMSAVEAQAAFDHMKTSGDFDKLEVLTDRGNDAIYTLGGRSFSIWKADTMEIVYDSGSNFEKITAQRFPEVFNWSNDDDAFEKRSAKKGPEPEDVKIGMVDGEVFAFVGLERIGGVMTYNITNPANAQFANYMNSRDFTQSLAGDVSPEGLEFVAAELSPTGRPLVLVGNEVSGTVSVNELQVAPVKVIQGVTLDQTQVSLKVGETVKLNAGITPVDTTESKDLTWSSSDEVVAQVSTEGVVTALTAGNATITVQTKDGKHTATTAITVTQIAPPVVEDEKVETPISGSDSNKENNKNGNKLPNTATNNYHILLLGATLISIGGVLYIVFRRKSTILE
ncbi:choice-of-anchor I family protein [Neobacillus sp. FSL H8-0543]|uniref:choice-of-anchor I family protein n=1 Tax=Neobacillus sp. FSL H8-0543 TaxID=2954672 RepID=UPI0031597C9E